MSGKIRYEKINLSNVDIFFIFTNRNFWHMIWQV